MTRRSNQLVVTFKAGDCRYYRAKCPDTGQSHEELGLLEFATAPDNFEPDLHKLSTAPGKLGELAEVLRDYDESQLRILMKVLSDSFRLRPLGLKFGQPVYKNMSAPYEDYADCWFLCYVVALGPKINNVQYIYLSGSLDDIHGTLIMVPHDRIMTRKDFAAHRKQLQLDGRIKSPIGKHKYMLRHGKAKGNISDYPTLTQVAERLTDDTTPVKSKTSTSRTTKRKLITYRIA